MQHRTPMLGRKKGPGDGKKDNDEKNEEQEPLAPDPEVPGPEAGEYSLPGIPGEEKIDNAQL